MTLVFHQVCNGQLAGWRLTRIPVNGFYQSLHHFLKKGPCTCSANKSLISELYVAIDPYLKAKGGRPDNIYRFVENLAKLPAHHPVNYRAELTQVHKVRAMRSEVEHCHQQCEAMTSELELLRGQFESSKERLQHTEKVLRDVSNQRDASVKSRDFVKKKLKQVEFKNLALEDEFARLFMDNLDLFTKVDDLESSKNGLETITTKHGRSYVPAVRKLYYSLLANEVPATKVANVVKDVLKAFLPAVEVENLPLPQHSCASYMRRDELATLSNAHKASVICQCGSSLHLNTDGTTKNQKKLGGIVINDIVVSVNELVDGSALTAVNDVSKELKTLRETAQV